MHDIYVKLTDVMRAVASYGPIEARELVTFDPLSGHTKREHVTLQDMIMKCDLFDANTYMSRGGIPVWELERAPDGADYEEFFDNNLMRGLCELIERDNFEIQKTREPKEFDERIIKECRLTVLKKHTIPNDFLKGKQ